MTSTPMKPTSPSAPAKPLIQQWPAPRTGAPPVVIIGSVSAAAVAAVAVPLETVGIGWPVGALAVAAAVFVLGRRVGTQWTADRAVWGVLAIALMTVGAVRAAEWLFALCVFAAVALASLAATGGRGAMELFFGAQIAPVAGLRALPWAGRGLRSSARGARVATVGRAMLLSIAVLVVFGALLISADVAISRVVTIAFRRFEPDVAVAGAVVFAVVGIGVMGAGFLFAAPVRVASGNARRTLTRIEWALPAAVLAALLAAFVLVQITTLFGGNGYVLHTAGVTYAEYAREGFWQLLAVSVMTLGVIAWVVRKAARETVADRWWLRVLLGAIAALSVVIVASALQRMWTYQQAYGFTVLRLLVEACELWLGLVFVLVIAAGVKLNGAWLPRAVVGTAALMLLSLAALNPEGVIAGRNVDRYAATGKIDLDYLSGLSADAVPALLTLPEPQRRCVLPGDPDRTDSVREWNRSRSIARDLLDDYDPGADPATRGRGTCYDLR